MYSFQQKHWKCYFDSKKKNFTFFPHFNYLAEPHLSSTQLYRKRSCEVHTAYRWEQLMVQTQIGSGFLQQIKSVLFQFQKFELSLVEGEEKKRITFPYFRKLYIHRLSSRISLACKTGFITKMDCVLFSEDIQFYTHSATYEIKLVLEKRKMQKMFSDHECLFYFRQGSHSSSVRWQTKIEIAILPCIGFLKHYDDTSQASKAEILLL